MNFFVSFAQWFLVFFLFSWFIFSFSRFLFFIIFRFLIFFFFSVYYDFWNFNFIFSNVFCFEIWVLVVLLDSQNLHRFNLFSLLDCWRLWLSIFCLLNVVWIFLLTRLFVHIWLFRTIRSTLLTNYSIGCMILNVRVLHCSLVMIKLLTMGRGMLYMLVMINSMDNSMIFISGEKWCRKIFGLMVNLWWRKWVDLLNFLVHIGHVLLSTEIWWSKNTRLW